MFLQRVSIACYAERCISHSKSVRLSVCPSVTRWHCVKTTQDTIIFTLGYPHDSSFLVVNFTPKFQREHREQGRRKRVGYEK